MASKLSIKELSKPVAYKWFLALFIDWTGLILTIYLSIIINTWYIYILATFIVGAFQLRIGLLSHDAIHYLIFRKGKRKLTWLIANIFTFWPFFVSFDSYVKNHYPHHSKLGHKGDPELYEIKYLNNPRWDLPMSRSKLRKLMLKDLFFLNFLELLVVIKSLGPKQIKDFVGIGFVWGFILFFLYYFNTLSVLIMWFLAIMGPYLFFFRQRGLIEHTGTQGTFRVSAKWWEKLTFFPHNTWCHWEHHKYQFIPFYNLPKVRKLDTSQKIITRQNLLHDLEHTKNIPSGYVENERTHNVEKLFDEK